VLWLAWLIPRGKPRALQTLRDPRALPPARDLSEFRLWRSLVFIAISGLCRDARGEKGPSQLGAQPQSFRVRRWTAEDGLPQSRVACLKQTRDGYLWIGTQAGLARFDGLRFTVYNKFNTPEMVSDAINALAEDSEGTLWIGTRSGLLSYLGHGRFQAEAELAGQYIPRLVARRDGGVWVQAGGTVGQWRGGRLWHQWPLEAGRAVIGAMSEGPDGWLNIYATLSWLALSPDGEVLQTNYVRPEGPSTIPTSTGWPAGKPGASWLGTREGLYRVEAGMLSPVAEDASGKEPVTFVREDRSGNLWVGKERGGLYRIGVAGGTMRQVRMTNDETRRKSESQSPKTEVGGATPELTAKSEPRGLNPDAGTVELASRASGPVEGSSDGWEAVDVGLGATVCMEEDREGNLWLGSDRGLAQLRRLAARTYTTGDGLADDDALSVCEASDGTVWVGTAHGLSCIRAGQVMPWLVKEPMPGWSDRCVWPSQKGAVWVVKSGSGLFEAQEHTFLQAIWDRDLPGLLNVLYGDHSGRLWVGTDGGTLAFQGQFTNPCVRITRDVRSVLEDRQGTLWFGTMKQGLVRLRQGEFSVFTTHDGLSHNSVWSLHEDEEDVLWIGTDHGLTRYRDGKFFAFTHRHGLPEPTVNCVLEDDAGCLWLSGLHGVHRVPRAQLNAVAEGRAATAQFISVGVADGMENPETNGGENQPAGWKASDGRLWFPTVQGVVVIDPKAVPEEPPPPVVIEEVEADGEATPNSEVSPARVRAGHGRVIEFRYTANTFVAPERTRFRYRLVGADAHWRKETSERTARYIDLKPGAYRFEVMAANHHNVWSAQPAVFAFSLAPFFWQTWPFYGLCAGLVMGFAAAVHGYRLRWQHRLLKLEEQRSLANERSRIARDLHDDVGASLTGLALQLEAAQRRGGAQGEHLGTLAGEARSLAHELRELAWTTNPRCDNAGSLAAFASELTERFAQSAGLACRLELPSADGERLIPARVRHEAVMVLKESLTNITKHAAARQVALTMKISDSKLELVVEDDGHGFDSTRPVGGSGLRNLRERMQQVGGVLSIESQIGRGTKVVVKVPLK